jgi:uncharacterized protein
VEPEFETQFVTAGSLLYSVEHRPWLPPDSQWLFSQSWSDVLFAHFAIDPSVLRRMVPEPLTLDLYDGAAWLTISPFYTSYLRPSGVPPLPVLSFFPQVSVRTYVTLMDRAGEHKPGIFYFSVDAANLASVWLARMLLRMPCWHAKMTMQTAGAAHSSGEKAIRFRSSRLHGPAAFSGAASFEAVYAPRGEVWHARRGSLDEFLAERYCAYAWSRRKVYRVEIHHQPWPLQRAEAEIASNSLGEPLGLLLLGRPDLCHFSRSNKLLTWAPQRVRLTR